MDETSSQCIICNSSTEENLSRVREKGVLTLLNASKVRKDSNLKKLLNEVLDTEDERLDKKKKIY